MVLALRTVAGAEWGVDSYCAIRSPATRDVHCYETKRPVKPFHVRTRNAHSSLEYNTAHFVQLGHLQAWSNLAHK